MDIQLQIQKNPKGTLIHLLTDVSQIRAIQLLKEEAEVFQAGIKNNINFQVFYRNTNPEIVVYTKLGADDNKNYEDLRISAVAIQKEINRLKIAEVGLINYDLKAQHTYCFLEGMMLANYQFLKYKSKAKGLLFSLKHINVSKESINPKLLNKLAAFTKAIYHARDLVNEPNSFLTATQLSEEFKKMGKEGMVKVGVYGQAKIEQLGMGGILAVNKGSTEQATFTIFEHKPSKAKNKKPIVLIGKGVVYDTGGLSLKPTPNSMDKMKSDMGGAAVVAGIMHILGTLDIPLHVIGLVPATDNRPGGNAYAPGDVVKMYSGLQVEVLNTDAEGRMILADALHFAKKYDPEWVVDFATLTGAAANAIGDVAMVGMGTIGDATMQEMKKVGYQVNEKIAEFPFWSEYEDLIKSDIADIKNIGGPTGGAITAGKFLQRFTDYPWVHFDIAGVSHRDNAKQYLTAGGTGFGIRMMAEYLIQISES